jgi:hypothetical protein
MKFHTFCFVFTAMLVSAPALSGSNNYSNSGNQLPTSLEQKVKSFRADLEARGYQVAQGSWHLFTIEDCKFPLETIGICMGNNPAAPYVIPTLPLWPDEFVDDTMKDLLGPTQGDTWWTYRLDEREALVVLAQLPPPGRYFSLETYVFTREGEINTNDEIYQSVQADPFMQSILFKKSPNSSRLLTFASIGDNNNNVVIEQQSGAAFDQQRFFIITSDKVMKRKLTQALLRAGVPDRNQVFTEPVSPDLARLGLGAGADDLMIIARYAHPEDEVAGDQWRQQLPLAVFRVRDPDTARATEPFPFPVRDERIAQSELELEGDVKDLVAAVKQRWGQPNAKVGEFESLLLKVDLLGEHCLPRPMNCIGDNSDADYQISPTAHIDSGEVLAVVGTLGTATGNATYVSLSPNWIPPLEGVLDVSDVDLEGSASVFSGMVNNTEKLYIHYFARDCTDLPNCHEITRDMIPQDGELKLVQRDYVVPGSTRGPDPTLLVNPSLIILDGASRPKSHADKK